MDALELAYGLAGLVLGAGMATILFARPWARPREETPAPAAPSKLTSSWRIGELEAPTVVARDVDAEVPAGARVLASGQVDAATFATANVRQVPPVAAEYALDVKGTKALLFLGGVRPGSTALVVTDRAVISRLETEARSLADASQPYIERHSLALLAGRSGVDVETQGTVQDILPHQGGFLLRLEDAGHILGVRVAKEPTELKGARILVRGRLGKDKGGYPVLLASDVRRIQ